MNFSIFTLFGQAFSKKKVEERKEWLTKFMINRRQRREHNLPEVKSEQGPAVACHCVRFHHVFFVPRTTCMVRPPSISPTMSLSTRSWCFSPTLTMRGQSPAWWTVREVVARALLNTLSWTWKCCNLYLPTCVSGLKPGQRKVLFCCFKRNDKREVKVAQLAGSVAEMSAYHHGEVRFHWHSEKSLFCTIMPFDSHRCFNSLNSPDKITTLKGMHFFRSLWWWPLLVWPKTLLEAITWTCCSLWDNLEPDYMVARTLPALDTSSPCWGQWLFHGANIL